MRWTYARSIVLPVAQRKCFTRKRVISLSVLWLICSKCPQTSSAYRRNVRILQKSWSLNPFPVTNLRPKVELIYLLRMRRCADIIVTKVAENSVARSKRPQLYRKTGAQNANMTSDFKPEVALCSKLRIVQNRQNRRKAALGG